MRTVALALALLSGGCACNSIPLSDNNFSVFRPKEVVIYRPQAGTPPADDNVYVYLALQNNSRPDGALCFAHWSRDDRRWREYFFNSVVPIVEAKSIGAPIVGRPQVELGGISGEVIKPGDRFPAVVPDPRDFPFNEASFRRDFAIVLKPDRSMIGKRGFLQISVSLNTVAGSPSSASQIAEFRIPVSLVNQFRPETMIPEPSEPPE